ncbi:MAG: hypothetical protein OXQ96_05795 [Alphaproteobacteria bacterium]|nr:hypothetical protein [Alphaproteobacteria bacterium]
MDTCTWKLSEAGVLAFSRLMEWRLPKKIRENEALVNFILSSIKQGEPDKEVPCFLNLDRTWYGYSLENISCFEWSSETMEGEEDKPWRLVVNREENGVWTLKCENFDNLSKTALWAVQATIPSVDPLAFLYFHLTEVSGLGIPTARAAFAFDQLKKLFRAFKDAVEDPFSVLPDVVREKAALMNQNTIMELKKALFADEKYASA